MGKKFKSIRTEITVYCFFSVILAMITDIVLGGLIYTVSSTLGKKQYDKVPVSPPPGRGVRFSRHGDDLGMSTGRLVRHLSRDTLVSFMLVTVIATICFFIIYVLLFIKRIVKDMTYISDRIIDIADGKSDEKIIIERQDEIGEIAGRINEMTEQINQLITSERDALQSNKDLIACVAHDLRTPITSVKGYLDLALDTKHYDLEQRQKYVRIAQTKANRLEYLIHDLFNYTKLTSGEITLHRSKIDLVQLVEQMVEEFYPLFQEEELECTTKYNISYLEMNMDGELIARAVQNLFSNAIKYGKDGKHVYVELECLEQEVQIRVTNYGLVIPEESIKHLFDKFYRVERSRNVKTGGTGLGLNIAQEIVHLHGGRIQVTSGASGTCFTIALPLHKEEEEE
ncbi:MAG: HAMP domain-containing sensor histidine kinase [Lachnospiraceae bacterium]|nr:HAMP domain-containing sensor histidine kinase [Lachnospiraceae bacterium]